MRTTKSKSFPLTEDIVFHKTMFSMGRPLQKEPVPVEFSPITLGEILRKILLIMQKLFVALKYQFFRKTQISPRSIKLPWFKLVFVALAAFIVFKKDLSFSVNMNSPEVSNTMLGRTNNLSYNSLAAPQTITVSSKNVNPFADSPDDDEKAKQVKAYIRRFQKVALTEKEKFSIPASVKMAQAIVESNAGNSRLAKQNNNHFGIKCFSKKCKKGHCSNFGDDHHKDFFRKYNSAWEGWRSHSNLIVNGRYKKLINHGDDFYAWAKGLKKLGYATDKKYTDKLIETIETYQLYLLDTM